MKNKLFAFSIFILFLFITSNYSCIQHYSISFTDILRNKTWRKTLEAVYNTNNEFEKYTFNFETAEDCEKNSFIEFGGGINVDQGNGAAFNLCNNFGYSFSWQISNDTLYIAPFDSSVIKNAKYIEYYDTRSFVLRYDTLINNSKKIIKETYWTLDLNKQK